MTWDESIAIIKVLSGFAPVVSDKAFRMFFDDLVEERVV